MNDGVTSVAPLSNRTIVALRVRKRSAAVVRERLPLAEPLQTTRGDPNSLWVGPDQWLLVSDSRSAQSVIEQCNSELKSSLHHAVDLSAGLAAFRLAGTHARDVLAAGSGVDFRLANFPVGACCRTRLAQIAAVVVSAGHRDLDVYVDRSYGHYITDWFASTIYDADLAAMRCAVSS